MKRGFTLIEVLVALAVAALGLGAALNVVTHSASNSVYLRDRVLASWIASNRLTEMRLAATLPSVDTASEVTTFAGRQWKWESTVTQTQVDGLRRIEVTVREDGADKGATLASVTGFVSRTAVAGTTVSADPFELQTVPGGGTGAPVVPATAPVRALPLPNTP